MKTTLRFISLFATVAILAASLGCSNSGGAKAVGSTLYQQVGGADGCSKLANQFGANLKSNPALNSVIDATVVTALQSGLTNDIMRASNMQPTAASHSRVPSRARRWMPMRWRASAMRSARRAPRSTWARTP